MARLNRALSTGPVWREIRVLDSTESTNAEVAGAARTGAAEGLVVIAERQSAGRGRLDRGWSSPARAGVLMSALLRPQIEVSAWPLIPLLAGLAVVEAVLSVGQVEATLKWPNDVLVDDRKLAGILVERVESSVVVGIGLNVSTKPEELPTATATSLAIAGGVTDREIIAKELLRSLARRYQGWHDTAGSSASVIPAYRERCETIGRHVELQLPGGDIVRGEVTAIDDSGALTLRDDATGAERGWLAGDVTHVRKAD
ncbi:MAG TPA: biotin--[acetyl-CoA-carboxylase] ligase [Mycobacteriales bacterium]|nr:biotin--[acetyl-CoA-carboxylase] ligase [Mycobacteriales bacterium]